MIAYRMQKSTVRDHFMTWAFRKTLAEQIIFEMLHIAMCHAAEQGAFKRIHGA